MKHSAGALLSYIKLDRSSRKGVGVQLYMALRDIILSGGLRAGDRLPATRILARELGVSRTTVIDSIERLVAEGMLVSRVGAGTFVSDVLDAQRPAQGEPAPAKNSNRPRLSYAITHAEPSYARRNWLPHEARAFITALPALDAFQ
nr:winged helix-turn-helix domain-containing protein [Marinicella sp. W31]MDC2875592.1 winged helix-turn-helix domain-containing protein [Marinicella sp. W31]